MAATDAASPTGVLTECTALREFCHPLIIGYVEVFDGVAGSRPDSGLSIESLRVHALYNCLDDSLREQGRSNLDAGQSALCRYLLVM